MNHSMKTYADLHTHSLASQHAYSTLSELCDAAKSKGMSAIALTDHGPGMPDGAIAHHFFCLAGLPDTLDGLHFYKGAEANIMDYDGQLDMADDLLDRLDLVIASYHIECIQPKSIADHTSGLIKIAANPHVDVIGHCGNPVFEIDPEPVVKACAENQKIIEINSASFKVRPGSDAICRKVALLCMAYKVPVIISSDAHSKWQLGDHAAAIAMLESIQFPQQLIINGAPGRTEEFFESRKRERCNK